MSEPKLLPRSEWATLDTEAGIREQVGIRADLSRQMVGQLYPSILGSEVCDLLDLIKELKMSKSEKVNVRVKRSDGYVSETKGLSYEAGLAVAAIVNRASAGLPVTVSWDNDGETETLEVKGK